MTIHELCKPPAGFQPTESQFEILQRADRLFDGARCGRFFGGRLSTEEVKVLTDNVELRKGTLESSAPTRVAPDVGS